MTPRALGALLRLRERLEAEAGASLARSLAAARAEAQALASARAELAEVRERVGRLRTGEDAGALLAAARFRERMRAEVARLMAAEGLQQASLASAEAAAEEAKGALGDARARSRAARALRERWLAARRAEREAAEERERDDAAPMARPGSAAQRGGPQREGG